MSLMFEDRYPLLFALILWTCSKRNAFLGTNMPEQAAVVATGLLKEKNNDKKPTEIKEILRC